MADFTIDTVTIPATIHAPDAADFIERTRVRNAVEAHAVGNSDVSYEPAELLPNWQDPYQPQVCLVARIDGKIVARALYMPTIEDDAKEVELAVEVLPEFRRRGIGSALYARLLELCATDHRAVLQGYFFHQRADESEQLPSPTGFGSVPSHNPETRFLLKNGFQLEQVERPVEQQDTLVLKEHRGHRLGLLLKLENLQYLAETHPGHPSVFTFNAEENRPMLTVNEAMGFAAMGYFGGWKKVETAP